MRTNLPRLKTLTLSLGLLLLAPALRGHVEDSWHHRHASVSIDALHSAEAPHLEASGTRSLLQCLSCVLQSKLTGDVEPLLSGVETLLSPRRLTLKLGGRIRSARSVPSMPRPPPIA